MPILCPIYSSADFKNMVLVTFATSCESFFFQVGSRAPQFKKVCLGNEVGSNMDQNEPLRLGFRSFASKLMDHDSIKVFVF